MEVYVTIRVLTDLLRQVTDSSLVVLCLRCEVLVLILIELKFSYGRFLDYPSIDLLFHQQLMFLCVYSKVS